MPLIHQAFIEWLVLCQTLFQVVEGGSPALKSQVGLYLILWRQKVQGGSWDALCVASCLK